MSIEHLELPNYDELKCMGDFTQFFPLDPKIVDQSIPVPGTETEEFSPIFRNAYLKGKPPVANLAPTFSTFYEVFEEAIKDFKDYNSVGQRRFNKKTNKFDDFYTWDNYETLGKKRDYVGSGIMKLMDDFAPEAAKEEFILTLFSANKPEWIITDLACHAYSIPNTPLYDTLGKESTEYILNLTKSPIILFSKSKFNKIIDAKSSSLKILISIEDLDEKDVDSEMFETAGKLGLQLVDFSQVMKLGSENPRAHIPPTPETLYTVSFTSGTTGIPKGVELRHKHIMAANLFLMIQITYPKNPISLVFLPLAHVYERFKINYEISQGGAIGFPHNPENPRSFMDDIKILKPSHMSSVPRLYNRIESGLKDKIKNTPGFKGWLLRFAVNYKLTHDDNDGVLVNLLNKFVINKIRNQIGFSNLDFLISGGSPLSAESIVYLRKVLNCGFYQGYGSSESFGGIAITTKYTDDPQNTGAIGLTAEFKLRNLPDLDYTYESNRSGELLLRGPQIFSRYFKNEEATKSAVDEDGWFSTGDIVKLDKQGRMKVIDRVKNFFKLSQGEYIASEKIENLYLGNNPFTNQFFAYGDSFQSHLIGIVGVELDPLFKLVQNSPLSSKYNTKEKLLNNLNDLELRKFVLKELNKNIEDTGLYGFEKVKNIHLDLEPFKIDDETITPTLKLKRNNAQKHFQSVINQLYAEGLI